jgi:hypothetical protein
MNKLHHIGEGGCTATENPGRYTVCDRESNAGATAVDVPHVASNGISFDAKKKRIIVAGKNLGSINTGDIITLIGETENKGPFTVARGGNEGYFTVKEDLIGEPFASFCTIAKRAHPTNSVVADSQTGLLWHRTPSHLEKIGPNSDGQLVWFDEDRCFEILPASGDLQMIGDGSSMLRIVNGAKYKNRFFPGMLIQCDGFESAINNAPGLRVDSVGVVGEDLGLELWTGASELVSEEAGGSRSIRVICQSIFAYAASANAAQLGGENDWRIPTDVELRGLCDMSRYPAVPDQAAFPEWTTRDWFWSSVTNANSSASAMIVYFSNGSINSNTKSYPYYVALVRG